MSKQKIQLSDHFDYSRLLRFVLPCVGTMLFTSIYGIVDGLCVSNFVGKTAFAAVNLIMPVPMLVGSVGFMLGTGGSAIVGITLGEGDREKADRYFSLFVWTGLILGIVLSAVGVLIVRPAAALLGAEGEMLDYAVRYGRLLMMSLPFFILQNMFQSFFVTAEKPHLGFAFTVAAGGTNMVLDVLLVGMLHGGVEGAAIATFISQAVGGVLPQLGTGAHLGGGDVFVAEADESDGSFLNYTPAIEIVTNVEPDHLDRYHSREEFEDIFVEFARRMVPGGLLVTCAEDEGAVRLAQSARAEGLRVVTYGRVERSLHTPDVVISNVRVEAHGASASLTWGERSASLALSVPGEHNVLNAAAAWVAGIECGLSPQAIADGLGEFTGAARRFEARGQVGSRRLFDDYAHHPTEVEAAIREAHVVAGEGDVTVVFQPHLYSRTRIFAERFAQALSGADHVVLAGIYGAREDPEPGVDSTLISSRIEGASYVEDMHEAARLAASLTPEGGVCLTMGAGSITHCAPDVLNEWKRMEA